jgi:hypothetical protein
MALFHGLLVMACGLYVSHGCYAFAGPRLTRGLPVNKSDEMWDLRQRGDEVVLLYGVSLPPAMSLASRNA